MNLRAQLLVTSLVTGCSYQASLGTNAVTQGGPSTDAVVGPDAIATVDAGPPPISPWPSSTLVTAISGIGLVHARTAFYWMDTATSHIMTMPDDASTAPTVFAAGPSNLDNVYPNWLVGDDTGLAYLVDDSAAATRSLVIQPFAGARTVVATRAQAGVQAYDGLALAGASVATAAVSDVTAYPRGGGAATTVAYAGAAGTSTACPIAAMLTAGSDVYVQWAGGDPHFGCPIAGTATSTSIAHVPITGGTPAIMPDSDGYDLGIVVGTKLFGNSSNTNQGNLSYIEVAGGGGSMPNAVATLVYPRFVGFAVANGVLYWSAINGYGPRMSEVGCVSLASGLSQTSITGAGYVRSLVAHGDGIDFRAECPRLADSNPCPSDELHHFACTL